MNTQSELRTRPIIFSGDMVLAILEDRKTQTRRVIKPQPYTEHADVAVGFHWGETLEFHWDKTERISELIAEPNDMLEFCPYGIPGDKLWVRETFKHRWAGRDGIQGPGIEYKADGAVYGRPQANNIHDKHWRPSTNMSRWASRLTLQIIDVRVEKLQEILYEDAVVEGIEKHRLATKNYNYWINYHPNYSSGLVHAQASFHTLWDYSINKKHEHRWGANPWVWVLEFEVVDE